MRLTPRTRQKLYPFYDLALEATEKPFGHTVFIKIKSLSLTHIQWEGNKPLPFEGRESKNVQTYFKTTP